jgi:tubulin polyglutamylase TTLL9
MLNNAKLESADSLESFSSSAVTFSDSILAIMESNKPTSKSPDEAETSSSSLVATPSQQLTIPPPFRFKTSLRNTVYQVMRDRGWKETENENDWDFFWAGIIKPTR